MNVNRNQLKIVLVGPTYPFRGGISHYTTLLCQHLRKRHEVRFFTFRRQYPTWLFPGRSDRDEASEAVLHVEGEAVLDGVNPLTWWRVARSIQHTPPDLLIVQWTVSYWIPMLWLLTRFAPPSTRTVMICHNASPHEQGRPLVARLMHWLQRQVMAQVDHLICHAESDVQELRTLLPEKPITRVMLPSYQALAELTPPVKRAKRGKPHLLFFGFVRPYKGVDLLLEAMPKVLAALPDAYLTVAGEWWDAAGDPEAQLDPALRNSVEIVNRYLPNEEMAALFHAADVVVLPYRSATQSAVVQLAYGFGVPVITTAIGGLPEAVAHEESGFVVPPHDPEALADAIIRYHTEGWRKRLAPGVTAARERFSWTKMIEELEGQQAEG
ncbi:MAG: glycosyltransferase family 4 protein [Chloroflexota bacterium]|nr:glycosyltransferase family 4 protein [Chloroflexota bacterium]